MMMFYLLIGTVSVVGNFIVLIVVYKSKQLRHSQYTYKCSIAVSDIIWGFSTSAYFIEGFLEVLNSNPFTLIYSYDNLVQPEIVVDKNITFYSYELQKLTLFLKFYENYKTLDLILKFILEYATPTTLYVSFVSLLFSSVDRYFALTFPFKYKQINSVKIAKKVSFFIWIFSAVIHTVTAFLAFKESSLPSLFFQPIVYSSYKKTLSHHITAATLFTLINLLWLFTFLTLCRLYKIYKRSLVLSKNAKNSFSSEKQMSLVLLFMVVAFTFSLASTIYFHVRSYFYDEYYGDKASFISIALLTTNSVWNVVIYNILNKKFRDSFVNLFFTCK